VDSQRGEVEWRGGNLYFDQWDYSFKASVVQGNNMNFGRLIGSSIRLWCSLRRRSRWASGDGSIVGYLNAPDKALLAGAEMTARNPATGLTRTVKTEADGRIDSLSTGRHVHRRGQQGRQGRHAPPR
jgi:hypothetical protein